MNKSRSNKYVSRAGDKLASVVQKLSISFEGAIVLDVGSSTGGFTDYALQNGAKMVYAVDSGTNQLHPLLRDNPKIQLYEKTDIRDFVKHPQLPRFDVIVIDVSFISLRHILPKLVSACGPDTQVIAMVKPQFEAIAAQKARGIVKNDTIRRTILKDFEVWVKKQYRMIGKADSEVSGLKGNQERFYLLKKITW